MDIFSKIKKFEEADYFNQNLSNVLIDEDRDIFKTGHELIEESDYFNGNLSNVLLDTSSDIFADSLALDEESDFFNQNLSNALIEDVDLDSIVDTLSLVETANQQSAVKYYKVEITKTPSNYTTATLSNGRFNGLRFKETTSTFETNAISENVVFTDSNNHDITAVVEYLNGRTESNNNSYNPSAFFVEDASQSWGGTPWNTIEGDSNEDLVYQVIFQSKIQLNDIKTLTFNDINDDNVSVNIKIYESNDLETWELLQDTDISYDSELNEYNYDYESSYSSVDPTDTYKIVLTTNPDTSPEGGLALGKFTELVYVDCLTPQSYDNLSEDIVFTDGNNNYNCTVSVNGRYGYRKQDYYAPHNFFAPSGKRICPVSNLYNYYHSQLIVTIKFTDPIAYSKIHELGFRFGYETNEYVPDAVKYELYNSSDELLYSVTKLKSDTDSNRDITITAELPSNNGGGLTMGKYGIIITATASGSYVGLNNFEFDYMDYEGCTDVFPSGTRNVTTNNVQFSYHDDNQDTDVVVNAVASYAGSRWQDNGRDYYDPSYLFKGCRTRRYTYGYGNPSSMGLLAGDDKLLIFNIKFSDEIPLDYIKSFKCKNYDEQRGCQTSNTINFKIYSLNDDLTFNETLYNVDCTKENSYYTVNL